MSERPSGAAPSRGATGHVRTALRAGVARRARAAAVWIRTVDPFVYLPRRRGLGPPTIGVVGYYGWGNYGDELFWEVFREYLTPGFTIRPVIGPDRRDPRDLSRAVRGSDVVLIGGGDLVVPWSSNRRYFERVYLRRPCFIAGVGVPVAGVPDPRPSQPRIVAQLRRFFSDPNVRFIAARDDESAAWIVANLEPRVKVSTSPDIVCAMSLPEVERIVDPPVFGVVVRGRRVSTDFKHVHRLCERAESLGYRVRRIVLATQIVKDRDVAAADDLAMPWTELVVSDDLGELTRAIGECTVLASMKFHGTVVATMFGIPTIVLQPSGKTRSFLRRIGRPDLLSAYDDPDLPEHVTTDMVPVDQATISTLRAGATELVSSLRGELIRAMRLPETQLLSIAAQRRIDRDDSGP